MKEPNIEFWHKIFDMKKIKIGTFNLNNLFERPKVMELEGFSNTGREVLNDVSKLNELLENTSYAGSVGEEIKRILTKYFLNSDDNEFIRINQIREKLYSRKRDGSGLELKVNGRKDWLGWVELIKQTTNEISLENTARVVEATGVDILCTVEVDNRVALQRFNELLLRDFGGKYPHVMVIDGNDERGIDVGLLSRFPIVNMVSHVDDSYKTSQNKEYKIFSRDCPEYRVKVDDAIVITILCNHLKSKGYGLPASSNAKRKRQANQIAKILNGFDLNQDFVVVAGDFNDTPNSEPLTNLVNYPGLIDVLNSPLLNGPKWTYHTGNDQIDYLLVSQALFNKLTSVQIERRGIFRRNNISFSEVTSKVTQASDHAAIWAEFSFA